MRPPPLIIGAGPAGTAAAITLARAGYRPTLIERSSGPTDKVCGDFLSSDTIQITRSLNIDPAALGAAPIHQIRLVHGERLIEAALPFPALGLSRRVLDQALLRQAASSGAHLQTGQSIRRLIQRGRGWRAESAVQGALEAETIFAATGKHDLRDIPRRHTASDAVGMKMYFALASGAAKALDGAVELTLFPGGYAGMQHVENGHSVLCIAVQQPAFQGCGASWAGLVAMIEYRNRRFTAMLAGARALLPRPLAIAGIPYGYRALAVAPDGLYRLGDQAAVIPSLTGDGMAIALYSGRTGAEAWLAGKTSTEYHLSLAGILAPQMRLANLLHHACVNGFTQPMTLRFAERFPTLLRHAAVRTRIPAQHPASRT